MSENKSARESLFDALNEIILEAAEDDMSWVRQFAKHGCSSGMLGALIYSHDCAEFLRKHEDAVVECVEEMAESGFVLDPSDPFCRGVNASNIAWHLAEEAARVMVENEDERYAESLANDYESGGLSLELQMAAARRVK
jgi:hypothetical protein